jgi:putative radical SAM enzyme (TIGR03279 family)
VTLSNLKDEDIARILRLGLSPLYISVHAYDPEVKRKLCANPQSTKVFEYMRTFAAHGISMHTQIVMVEGLNDGDVLKETLDKLYEMAPQVQSVAVVPVGLTGHREGLYPLHPVGKECARATVEMVETMQKKCLAEWHTHWVWCSDEMYILAELPMPEYDAYEDFVQIENGVGMVSTFVHEVEEALTESAEPKGEYTLVTGVAFAPILQDVCRALMRQYDVQLHVKTIDNRWFGETVTVAGLLTGVDIIKQLKALGYTHEIILPDTTLKEFETVLLDGMSVADIERELRCNIHICAGGGDFIRILTGAKKESDE